jgi:ABC-type transporter Mla subunit MlaD
MLKLDVMRDRRVLIGLLAVLGVSTVLTAAPKALAGARANLMSHNLFALIDEMSGTTSQLMENTNALHQQITQVEGQLGQLYAQDQIVSKQLQTTQQLAQALSTQEDLTQNGVSLMQQIMTREQKSVALTHQVADQAIQMTGTVQQNVGTLQQLLAALSLSNQESAAMNGKMDALLSELSNSENNFKFFGQLNNLLSKLHVHLPSIPSLPSLPVLGGKGTGGSGPSNHPSTPSGPSLPLPSTPSVPLGGSSSSGGLGGVVQSVTNAVGSLFGIH